MYGDHWRGEKKNEIQADGDLTHIKSVVNGIVARLPANASREGSVLTAYTNYD